MTIAASAFRSHLAPSLQQKHSVPACVARAATRCRRLPSAMSNRQSWWVSGKVGSLSPWSQAKVFGAFAVARAQGTKISDREVAAMVHKVGPDGRCSREHPSPVAIYKLRNHIDNDPDWYPGKVTEQGQKRGPKPLFTAQKKRCVAEAAMAVKRGDVEPTVSNVILRAPRASLNPATGLPFTPKCILQVFRKLCYDDAPSDPWDHQLPYQKTALSAELIRHRLAWRTKMAALGHTGAWYARNCVWADPCSRIIPGSTRTAFHQKQSKKGKAKRWISKASKQYSKNLRAAPYANKQKQWGDGKAWWFLVVARGKVRLVPMGRDWEQTGHGMAAFVNKLPQVLRGMCGARAALPRILFTDRGPGFYQSSHGAIVEAYAQALKANKFKPFAGANALWQPPDLADLLMHETVAAWVRRYFVAHPVMKTADLETNWRCFEKGLAECEAHINKNYDVHGLSESMPVRLQKLRDSRGDRLHY